ncbi:YkuS family protein [Wukongibacter baidiensis]|uniref:YkuS family protein n=1 Tax=Wukongibacter baidiensis TaxID=1723361 RepID=UPI003D7F2197
MKRVAVEKSLSNVKDYLKEQGYDVESLENNRDKINSFDAIVVTGQNSNFLGMHDTSTNGTVVYAKGLTPEDVHKELQRTL